VCDISNFIDNSFLRSGIIIEYLKAL